MPSSRGCERSPSAMASSRAGWARSKTCCSRHRHPVYALCACTSLDVSHTTPLLQAMGEMINNAVMGNNSDWEAWPHARVHTHTRVNVSVRSKHGRHVAVTSIVSVNSDYGSVTSSLGGSGRRVLCLQRELLHPRSAPGVPPPPGRLPEHHAHAPCRRGAAEVMMPAPQLDTRIPHVVTDPLVFPSPAALQPQQGAAALDSDQVPTLCQLVPDHHEYFLRGPPLPGPLPTSGLDN